MPSSNRPPAKKSGLRTKVAAKVDLWRERRALYTARANKPVIVDAGSTLAIAIDGKGHPSRAVPKFEDAIAALFLIAYGIKFIRKKAARVPDFAISGLEAMWWVVGRKPVSASTSLDDWRWTAFLAVPDFTTAADLQAAVALQYEKATPTALLRSAKLRRIAEGKSIQVLHVGPYDQEGPTVDLLHDFADANGLEVVGKHHEIYLDDPARTDPKKLRTILRFSVR